MLFLARVAAAELSDDECHGLLTDLLVNKIITELSPMNNEHRHLCMHILVLHERSLILGYRHTVFIQIDAHWA